MVSEFSFIRIYRDLANNCVKSEDLNLLFDELKGRVSGTDLEKWFVSEDSPSRLDKAIAVDAVAHAIHQSGDSILQKVFPGADNLIIKSELDLLAGNDPKSEVRKYNRGYFTTLLDNSVFEFLEKADGRSSREDITEAIQEYEKLFKAGLASKAELLTLSRYYPNNVAYQKAVEDLDLLDEDNQSMVIGGPASVETIDRQKHLITLDALRNAFSKFMQSFRTRNAQILHTNVQAAWVLPAFVNKAGEVFKSGIDDKSLWIICELRDDTGIARRVADEIRDKRIKSYSIAGTAIRTAPVMKGMNSYTQVDELELQEITLCAEGVNQGARFEIIKSLDSQTQVVQQPDIKFIQVAIEKHLESGAIGWPKLFFEDGQNPCIIIDADRSNSITDALELQLRKAVPDFPIEVRSIPFAEWTPLNKSDENIGFITAGVGNSRINVMNMQPMDTHWFFKGGDKMPSKSNLEQLTEWLHNEDKRRKNHRKQMDEQGFPPNKDFDNPEFEDFDTKFEKDPKRKIKSSKGTDQKDVQRPTSG